MKPAVVHGEPAAAVLGINFDEAAAELNITPGVIHLRLNRRCDDRINSYDRYDEQRAAGFERFNRRAEKRTLLVDRVPQRQGCGKNRQPIEMEFENIKVAEIAAFDQGFIPRVHDPELRFHHAVLIFITDADHQRRLPIQPCNDQGIAEHDTCDRARKAHEDEAGHRCEQKNPSHDFNGRDDMGVQRLRIHVAVADRGQRLHAEEEAIKKPMPASAASDTVLLDTVKRGEKKIEPDIKTGDKRGESRPFQTEQPAIDVAPSPGVRPDFDELDLTGADGNLTWLSALPRPLHRSSNLR